jgi:hypothetical protein
MEETMSDDQPVIAVIEWSKDSGWGPTVFLADNPAAARRAVVKVFRPPLWADDERVVDIDGEWVRQHPAPDLDDDAKIVEWLEAQHDENDRPWITFYTSTVSTGPNNISEDEMRYVDVRGRGVTVVGPDPRSRSFRHGGRTQPFHP